jgi:hypothetical protein
MAVGVDDLLHWFLIFLCGFYLLLLLDSVIPAFSLYETPFRAAIFFLIDDALMNLEMYSPTGSRKCAD